MKLTNVSLALLLTITYLSCSCPECFSPPNPFMFELVDQDGNNLLTSEGIDQDVLKVEDSEEREIAYERVSDHILINTIGWETEMVTLLFKDGDNLLFELFVDAERTSEDCCEFTVYKSIEVIGADFIQDSSTDIYRVVIE